MEVVSEELGVPGDHYITPYIVAWCDVLTTNVHVCVHSHACGRSNVVKTS